MFHLFNSRNYRLMQMLCPCKRLLINRAFYSKILHRKILDMCTSMQAFCKVSYNWTYVPFFPNTIITEFLFFFWSHSSIKSLKWCVWKSIAFVMIKIKISTNSFLISKSHMITHGIRSSNNCLISRHSTFHMNQRQENVQ